MTDNPKGEFIWRMLGSIIGSFCREFGVENMKKILKYMADNDEFWNLQELLERTDPGDRPFERGAHDFLTDKPPRAHEDEEDDDDDDEPGFFEIHRS